MCGEMVFSIFLETFFLFTFCPEANNPVESFGVPKVYASKI